MCIAIPAKIEKIEENIAIVSSGRVSLKVNIAFINEPKIGEYVLVHAGCAIEKIDKKEAEETLEIFKELAESISEGY